MGGWYVGAKYGDRVRQKADTRLAMLDEQPDIAVQLARPGRDPGGDSETVVEELIGSGTAWFADLFFAAANRWWRRLRAGLRPLGAVLDALTCAPLATTAIVAAAVAKMLPDGGL